MAKKKGSEPEAAPAAKRTPEEKAQRKTDKTQRKATKALTDDRAGKQASQKKTIKAAAKQLQKELDNRMGELMERIRKETKARLKEVVNEATRRLDVDTEQLFEQALHTLTKHYDSLAPGRTHDITLPAPAATTSKPGSAGSKKATAPVATEPTAAPARRPTTKPAATKAPAAGSRSRKASVTPSTPEAVPNDGAAVDMV